MQKTLIGILVAVVVIGGIWLFTRDNTADLTNNGTEQQSDATSEVGSGSQAGEQDSGSGVSVDASISAGVPVVVRITDEGFSPASVTVKKGQAVRWSNNADVASWPASAVHPTHAVYPQKGSADCSGSSFDACSGVAPGESWSFTFTKVGSWKYHDHLKPSKTGTVVVTE